MGLEELEAEALKLENRDRALLAERLLLSLEAPTGEENLELWVAEAERRLADLRAGRAEEISAEVPLFFCRKPSRLSPPGSGKE